MKHFLPPLTLIAACMTFNASAQYIPPDPFNDNLKASYGIWPNMGQVTDDQGNAVPDVSFYTTGAMPRAFFRTDASFSLVLATSDTVAQVVTQHRLDISCVGPMANYPAPVVWQMKDQYAHFYLPQCGPGGATNVYPYHRVIYPEIYDYIDMHIYSGRLGQKLAFVINPGGDPKEITLQFEGQDNMDVDIYGNLRLLLADQWVILPQAMAYQVEANGTIIPVNWTASYSTYGAIGRANLEFDTFDTSKPLVFLIGPPALGINTVYEESGLCWSTYYGGEAFDMLTDIKPDNDGNFYVAGRTESGWMQFPHLLGTSNGGIHGTSVATLTKFDLGHDLIWTVYHGGMGTEGYPESRTAATALAVKTGSEQTYVYMVGYSDAMDFHVKTQAGAYNDTLNWSGLEQGFVAKYKNNGELQWCTLIGAEIAQVQAIDILPDNERFVISGVVTDTLLLPNRLPPSGGYSYYQHGWDDAFVALFNDQDNVVWSACYGGSDMEHRALVKAMDGRIVVAGNTDSPDLPVSGSGQVFAQNHQGGTDVFVATFDTDGVRGWTSYFGGTGNDILAPQGLAVDKVLFITGKCGTLPAGIMEPGTGWYDTTPTNAGDNGFIAKFTSSGVPLWVSYLGKGTNHSPWCLYADEQEGVLVGGYTNDEDFPLWELIGHYYQPVFEPDSGSLGQDGFLIRFDDLGELVWGTLFGGKAGGLAQPQNVRAVHDIGGSTYAVGYTTMPITAPGNDFPLDGVEEAGYYFNPDYNFDGSVGGHTDGFIVEFCHEMTTGLGGTTGAARDALRANWSENAGLILLGLPDGLHDAQVFDAQGRLVLRQPVRSQAGRSEAIPFAPQGSALYIAVVDGQQAGRFILTR